MRQILACAVAATVLAATGAAETIRVRGFEAFRKGQFGNGGSNLYVSKQGRVQVINRWDLNNDGYNDVLISNDHDDSETVDALIYWNSSGGFKPLLPALWKERPLAQTLFGFLDKPNTGITRLPAFGGGRSLIADLNGDGYPELVFCNYIHNYPGLRSAYVYWGGPDGYSVAHKQELPTNWAAGVAAADLNKDGYVDLVFANQGAEAGLENISRNTGLDSYIYWGTPRGFDATAPTRVPTQGAVDVATGDFNGDGETDLAFLNSVREAKNVQIFWGGAGSYSAGRMQIVNVPNPVAVRAGDLDLDGRADLVIATSAGRQTIGLEGGAATKSEVWVLYGGKAGLDAARTVRLPAAQPRDAAIARLNGDKYPDIVIANSDGGESTVYWGGPAGFTAQKKTALPTMAANGAAVGDFNGDGFADIVFANSTDGVTYDVPSWIYWGSATGFAAYMRSELQSFGAASVSAADLNRDGRPEAVFINQYSGRFSGKLESAIFWGNPHHYYSTASMTRLPARGAYDTTAADFNDDGYPDVFFSNAYIPESYLYSGGKDGFSAGRRQMLKPGTSFASSAADLNRDGYLDLVVSSLVDGKATGNIFWGSAEGFQESKKTVLPLKAKRSALTQVIADFNRDGFLDLSFSDHYFGMLEIFWGGPQGYSTERTWGREIHGGGLGVADLNGDGILDFVVPGMFDAKRMSYNNRTRVFLGKADGTPSEMAIADVEAYGTIECAISDLNRDGKLDLACTNYMSDATRELPMFIYWGLGGGKFSDSKRTVLPASSSAGIQPLDLNADGYPDLVVHNHLRDGEHSINTNIYWNGPQGFDAHRKTELPAFGPHFSQMAAVGNQASRKLEEDYISEAMDIGAGRRVTAISAKAAEPKGSKLVLEVRQAAARDALRKAAWGAPSKAGAAGMRWAQYRAVFTSTDAASWPVLEEVTLTVE